MGSARKSFAAATSYRKGETTATSQIIHEKVDLDGLLNRAFELTDYQAKQKRFAEQNQNSRQKKGIGFATFMHGAGFTGSGEKYLESVVGAEATSEGRVRILAASTEIGQGTNTVFAQIAAEALHLDYDSIEVAKPDTGNVPNSGPTVASRTTMIVGKLVESAVLGLKQTLVSTGLLKENYTRKSFRKLAGDTSNSTARSNLLASIKRRPASTGTTKNMKAMLTALMPGLSMWPK